MRNKLFGLLSAVAVGLFLATSCASAQGESKAAAASTASCPSKWVASGNNGPKAGLYYNPNCHQ